MVDIWRNQLILFSVCVCYRLCVANSFVDREMIAYLKMKKFKCQIEKALLFEVRPAVTMKLSID